MPGNPSVAIRLGVVGDDEVKTTLAAIGDANEASATRAGNAWARASKEVVDALARQEKAQKQVQAIIGGANDNGGRYVGDQNAQVKAYQANMAQQQRAAEALRNAIEPLRVAQAAYDREVGTAATLLRTGAISQEEYAKAVALADRSLTEQRGRLAETGEGMNRMGASGMIAEHVVRSFSDSIAAGQSPMRAMTMESGRVIEAFSLWAQTTNRAEGVVGSLAAFMSGGWGLAITLGVSVLGPLVGELFKTDDAAAKAAEHGLAEFAKRQQDLARFVDATTGKLREQNRALAQIAAVQLPTQAGAKGVEAQGYINQAFAAARAKVAEAGSSRAGPNDAKLSQAIYGAGSNATTLLANVNGLVAGGRSDLRGLVAELAGYVGQAREAVQAGRQLQGQQIAVTTALRGGTVATTDLAKKLVDRALATDRVSKAQQQLSEVEDRQSDIDAMPYGPAKIAAIRQWQVDLTSARRAVESAQAADKSAAAGVRDHAKALREAAKAAEDFQKVSNSWMGEVDKKNAEGAKKLATESLSTGLKTMHEGMATDQTDRTGNNSYLLHQLADQREALALSQVELSTVGLTTDQREQALAIVRETIAMQGRSIDLNSDEASAVFAGIVAQRQMNQAIERASSSMQEVRDFASQFVDDLTSGKNVVKDLQQEFIKLALLNPLKNLISGNSNAPTLGSVFGSFGKLFGKGGGNTPSWVDVFNGTNGFASGTDYAPGGLAWVGEMGPELMNVPRGASILPAGPSRRLAQAANDQGGGGTTIHVYAQDAVLADTVRSWVQQGMQAAAVQGAHGGAQLAQVNATKRVRYRIPGR